MSDREIDDLDDLDRIVNYVQNLLAEDPEVNEYYQRVAERANFDFDPNGAMTELQESQLNYVMYRATIELFSNLIMGAS